MNGQEREREGSLGERGSCVLDADADVDADVDADADVSSRTVHVTVCRDSSVKRRACSGTSAGKLLVAPPSHPVAPTAPTNCARRSSPNRHRHRGTDIEFGTIFPPGPICCPFP